MPGSKNISQKKTYKSPLPKLVEFFRTSRDKWKKKCREAKNRVKLLTNQVRYNKKRIAELKDQVKELETQLEMAKKQNTLKNESATEQFSDVPACHKYFIRLVMVFQSQVLPDLVHLVRGKIVDFPAAQGHEEQEVAFLKDTYKEKAIVCHMHRVQNDILIVRCSNLSAGVIKKPSNPVFQMGSNNRPAVHARQEPDRKRAQSESASTPMA